MIKLIMFIFNFMFNIKSLWKLANILTAWNDVTSSTPVHLQGVLSKIARHLVLFVVRGQ